VNKLLAVLGVFAAGVLLVAAIGFFGREQIAVLGSTAEFRADPTQMREVIGSSLGWVGAAGVLAVVISWVVTLWRLMLLGRVVRPGEVEATETVPEPSKKARGTKKKAS
jgi:hypothetical protein